MARYSKFQYSLRKYGTTATNNLLWAIEIDWDGDGIYNGAVESNHTVGYILRRGRRAYLQSSGRGFGSHEIGKLTLTMRNDDGRYDPYNTNSPLYGYIEPGKKIRVSVKNGNTGSIYDRFTGIVDDIRDMGNEKMPRVKITAVDGWSWLQNIETSIYPQANIKTGAAIGQVLTDVEYPWGTDLEEGVNTIAYWWEDGRSAADVVKDLSDAEIGLYAIRANGDFKYITRYNMDDEVVTVTQSELLKDISLNQPWDYVRNVARIVAHPITLQSSVEIWGLNDTPEVKAGSTLTVWANFTYDGRKVAALSIDTPVATTDYTMNAQADGGGADQTSDWTVTVTNYGERAKVVYANNGSNNGYITMSVLNGDALDSVTTTTLEVDNSGTGQARIFEMDNKYTQSINNADELSYYLSDYLSGVRGFPIVKLENRPTIQFTPDLTDRVSIAIAKKGLDARIYRIGYIEEEWLTDNGQSVVTTWHTEPGPEMSGFWVFDANLQFDVNTIFGL